ncbi:sensor histidine kinase [Pseudaestuariivita rosea]|uniref:sensor histidine kinase n=1 Tax=Pseudaestuariivita rosea TaxID=2763263 RepID=UPI001F204CE7|nr:HAMP domain-containing sensor histidine kinase [Pseudaestuariivita rosea]
MIAGVVATWGWTLSQYRWSTHLDAAFLSGLLLYDTLAENAPTPPGVTLTELSVDQSALADQGRFNALAAMSPPSFVTQVSVLGQFPDEFSGARLSIAVVSPDLQYPVADISADGSPGPAATLGGVTRLLASYCSDPVLFARYGTAQWVRIDGDGVWGCSAAPADLRLPSAIGLFIVMALILSTVLETSSFFRDFAHALRERRHQGGPDEYQSRGPVELRETIDAVNHYLGIERDILAERAMILSGVSHDLGTPATRLKLRSALITDDTLRGKLNEDIDQMTQMIESVLTYTQSEISAEAPRRLSLTSLLESIVDDYRDVGKPVTFIPATGLAVVRDATVFESRPTKGTNVNEAQRIVVTARPVGLQRAIANLIDNALKYGRKALVTVEATSDVARIVIEDEGTGLGDDDMQRLIAPFERGPNTGHLQGVGLGLTIVSTIARQHGGTLTFARGSTGLRAILTIARLG